MSYERIMRAVYATPWAILEDKLNEILAFVDFKARGGQLSGEELAGWKAMAEMAAARSIAKGAGAVQVLPIFGMITHRGNMMSNMSGGTSTEKFAQSFRQALADPAVKAIVLDVDSPGGTVDGVPELAAEIASARGQKPVTAVANTLMASAAYWIAAQADEIVVSPSGQVGSIGIIAPHVDESEAATKAGLKTTFITAGKYKAEGHPLAPLTDEAIAHKQGMVDEMYGQFVKAVAGGRRVSQSAVREGYGQGRMLMASQAVKAGMADKIGTLDQVLASYGVGRSARGMAALNANEQIVVAIEESRAKAVREAVISVEERRVSEHELRRRQFEISSI